MKTYFDKRKSKKYNFLRFRILKTRFGDLLQRCEVMKTLEDQFVEVESKNVSIKSTLSEDEIL